MEMTTTTNRIHPLVAAASVSVILVSLVGVAAMTGVLPNSHSKAAPDAPIASLSAPAQTPAAEASQSGVTTSSVPKHSVSTAKSVEDDASAPVAKHTKPKPPARPSTPNYAQTASASHSAPAPIYAPPPAQVAQAPICHSCGRVEAVNAIQSEAAPSGLGAVAGGVVGGLLGNQVGGGNGRTLATVAGAVGGGFAGHEIEKRTRSSTTYQVRVRMENGRVRTFPYNNPPSWSVGDRVKVVDGYLTAQG